MTPIIAQAETDYLVAAVLVFVNTIWLASLVLGVPGTWLILLSTGLAAWMQWEPGVPPSEQVIGVYTLLSLLGLAVLGEVLEFIAGAAGAQKAGGSAKGALGAIVGGVIGAIAGTFLIPIPLLGSLLGAAGGAGLVACGVELAGGKTMETSVRIGVGASVGRILGTIYKLVVGFVMWALAAVAAFVG
ncbi:MAG TPA: DUF456 family protein [Phycisphaerae bacterium]|nr:DUF456 family protein [Phycisphaerae bacterium]HPU25956.1 DUF456 family protein [Phycisphaerae bacterium]